METCPFGYKAEAIQRCYINGESIKSVATDIGYSSQTIINWYQHYAEKGLLYFMKPQEEVPKTEAPENIEALKAQMHEMQLEIDILKETINVLKKRPRRQPDQTHEQREDIDS